MGNTIRKLDCNTIRNKCNTTRDGSNMTPSEKLRVLEDQQRDNATEKTRLEIQALKSEYLWVILEVEKKTEEEKLAVRMGDIDKAERLRMQIDQLEALTPEQAEKARQAHAKQMLKNASSAEETIPRPLP